METINQETGEIIETQHTETASQPERYEVDIITGKVTADVFTRTEAGLIALRGRYPVTLDPEHDYPVISEGVREVKKLRTSIEKTRKDIKEPFLKAGRIIDAEAKRITLELEAILDPLLEKKKIIDDAKAIAEEKRLDDLDTKAAAILLIATRAEHGTLEEISAALEEVNAIDTLNGFYERQLVACENKAAAVATLKAALIRRNEQDTRDREAEEARQALAVAQAELARQQAAAEEQAAAQAEELRKEREELAKLRAEADKLKQEAQARIDAEAEAKRQAEIEERRTVEEAARIERQRIAREEAERVDKEKAAADLAASEAEQARRERNRHDTEKLREWEKNAQESLHLLFESAGANSDASEQFANVAVSLQNSVESAIFELIGE
jgi:DNA repair exonuclease SbcCD ATPase subunit